MDSIAGVVLAGGKSTRMGRDKAFVDFRGEPLVGHAIKRLAPQVARVAISANGDPQRFAAFGAPVLPDVSSGHPGPLAGILAGLKFFARENGFEAIVTVPCDAPFAPRDLVARLVAARRAEGAVVAASTRGVEPLFALWPLAAADAVEAALAQGDASVWRLLEGIGAAQVDIPVGRGADWTLNLNAPEELAAAEGFSPS